MTRSIEAMLILKKFTILNFILFLPTTLMKLLIFTWNTQSVKLCETDSESVSDQHRSGYQFMGMTLTSWRYTCAMPDFWPFLLEKIQLHNPDVVVIGFQEDRHPGSYFHSHFLPEKMPEYGYTLVKRTKMLGLGKTSYDNLKRMDPMRRGIRCSVYSKELLKFQIERRELSLRTLLPPDGQDEFVCSSGSSSSLIRGKGGTISYLSLPEIGTIAFVCVHLPFNSRTLIEQKVTQDKMIRQTELNSCNAHFNQIVSAVLHNLDGVNHVFFFGDLNYRLSSELSAAGLQKMLKERLLTEAPVKILDTVPSSSSGKVVEAIKEEDNSDEETEKIYDHILPNLYTELYTKYDELYEQMNRGNIYHFQEGVNNAGPQFDPTYKLDHNRRWKLGRWDQRVPSWCDRILYRDNFESSHRVKCLAYERFDCGKTMAQSDHAAVLGIYELGPK